MSTAAKPGDRADVAENPNRQRLILVAVVITLAVSWYFIWRHFQSSGMTIETVENRPLLKQTEREFRDTDIGFRFTPPPRWSRQAHSTEAEKAHSNDRLLVKFKRLLPNAPAAWFRVHLVDVPADEPLVEAVKNRKPGQVGWTHKGGVETLTVAGLPAAKIQYGGHYNGFASVRDIIGVRRGGQVFFFVLTYQIADRSAQEQAREAMSTVLFETR
jgi:hypothetical protein